MIIGVINDEEIATIIVVDINRRHIFAARALRIQHSMEHGGDILSLFARKG